MCASAARQGQIEVLVQETVQLPRSGFLVTPHNPRDMSPIRIAHCPPDLRPFLLPDAPLMDASSRDARVLSHAEAQCSTSLHTRSHLSQGHYRRCDAKLKRGYRHSGRTVDRRSAHGPAHLCRCSLRSTQSSQAGSSDTEPARTALPDCHRNFLRAQGTIPCFPEIWLPIHLGYSNTQASLAQICWSMREG